MKNIIKKLFYIVFFKNLTLIKNKVIHQTTNLKELSAFFIIKSFLLISKLLPIPIDIKNKSYGIKKIPTRIYKNCQKYFLLFFINIFTVYLKHEKKIFFFLMSCIFVFSLFILVRHNLTNLHPQILQETLAPNSSQILNNLLLTREIKLPQEVEEIIIAYFFPFCSILMLCSIAFLMFDYTEYYPFDESFAEICLIFFLQIYTKNFIEDTQEEIIEVYSQLDEEFDATWDFQTKFWFAMFFLGTKNFWFVDFHHYWPMLKKRESTHGEAGWFFQAWHKYTTWNLRVRDPNWKFYQFSYPFPSMEEKHYNENFLIELTNIYNQYLKVILFKVHPFLINFENSIILFFILCFFFFIITTLLVDIYLSTITTYFTEQITYTIYRPFLDNYFYNWRRIFFKLFQTKSTNFLIRDPYLSQYLDLFYFIPDEENDNASLFESIFHAPLEELFPTMTGFIEDTLLDESDEEMDEIDSSTLNTISPSHTDTISFMYFLTLIFCTFLFFEWNRRNPIFFSGKTNFFHLPKYIPLNEISVYSWLFQKTQLSPLFHYLNWPGWKIYISKQFLIEIISNFYPILLQKKIKNNKILLKTYWNKMFFETFPPLIFKITYYQKIKGAIKRKNRHIKNKIIWFGKGLIEFFLTTTILPRFRFKRIKNKTPKRNVKKILLTLKQNRLFLLRKESYKKIIKK